jgi:hypothetical protein
MSLETVEAKIKADLSWLQRHERLVLAVIGGLVLWFGVGKIDTLIQNHDHAALQQAQVVAAVQQEKNQALAAQVAEQAAEYKALADKVNAQNAALEQANVNLANALIKQQHTDAGLPPTELVARLNTLVPNANASITNGQTTLPQSGTVAVVQQLEQVPVLTTQLQNKGTELDNAQKLLGTSQGQVTTLTEQVTGLQVKAVDDAKVCAAQIAVVRADARKSKRRWFYAGVVVGFVGRQILKTYTGM